ncbi:Abhydrolase domain-containing protein 1 [Symbiodinium microadriaticum]|uniref:Abhydrolase domain-containing protein 1 n=1 Tax=Symbiodinium microadriaticum TaxID=2951 RepID=A0A1Q9E1T6_SYMMI|nr:Abhydrolase domain-containing protein 1 [Symbiodinium microadriaticum]
MVRYQAEDFGRLVLVLLGFTQHSKMRMIQSLMAQFREEGFQVVALNQRCETAEETGHKITAPKVTCLDNFRDLMEITQHILARHPQVELSAVGFSMGGTQLLRHLGSQGAKTPFRSAVAIAPHLDVPSWARSLSSSRGKRILSYLMSQLCKQYIKATLEGTKAMDLVDSASLKSAGSLQEVEQAVVCPLHGYAAVDEYYAAVSPHAFLGQIAVPTLILHTEDDPWVPFDSSIIKQLQSKEEEPAVVVVRTPTSQVSIPLWKKTPRTLSFSRLPLSAEATSAGEAPTQARVPGPIPWQRSSSRLLPASGEQCKAHWQPSS